MNIPIENIYYLLSYAWDKLDIKDKVKVDIDDNTKILDLLAKILITTTKTLLKRGIDRSYIDYTTEIAAVKGKLELSQSLKSNLLYKQHSICTFDEFSPNILSNRILITTLFNLTKTKQLDKDLKLQIHNILKMFSGIDLIQIDAIMFQNVKITRNNRFYSFVLDVCRLIYENLLPSETKGKFSFYDFTRDEKKMNKLFEAFVRNFYAREQREYTVKREDISWSFSADNTEHINYLPKMQTDITLVNAQSKIIIDAKYYKETMSTYFNAEKIKSHNLYQIFSYLINQHDHTDKSKQATGILLYPTTFEEYNLQYTYLDHKIRICTINLNQEWVKIHKCLVGLLQL